MAGFGRTILPGTFFVVSAIAMAPGFGPVLAPRSTSTKPADVTPIRESGRFAIGQMASRSDLSGLPCFAVMAVQVDMVQACGRAIVDMTMDGPIPSIH